MAMRNDLSVSILKRIPGFVPFYVRSKEVYYSLVERLGFTPNKSLDVSRSYWEKRAVQLWEHDRNPDPTMTVALSEIVARLREIPPWESLLEVGCGFGRVLRGLRLVFPSARLMGVDFSFKQLLHGRTYLVKNNVPLLQASSIDLPFPPKRFDLVITNASLIYLNPTELERTLGEFRRVCGRVLLAEYSMEYLDSPHRRRLLRRGPFYAHNLTASLKRTGWNVVSGGLMSAWQDQPMRLPLSLVEAEVSC